MLQARILRRLTYVKPTLSALCTSENEAMRTFILLIAIAALAGCQREGPAEKAGRQVDRAAQKAGDNLRDAGDKIRDAANGKK